MSAELLTVREIAEALSVTPARVYQLVSTGEIPAMRYGLSKRGTIRIPADSFGEWVRSRTVPARAGRHRLPSRNSASRADTETLI